MAKVFVVAAQDFQYTETVNVWQGQVFPLFEMRNDPLLVKHRLVFLLDPQPTPAAMEAMPTCGECGRVFVQGWQRDRCGRQHEMPDAERLREAHARANDRIDKRVIQVGG